ncbi:MAG: cytidylate kinase-like family protein [Eubacterium sp.]|jgi:cytidylate kinase|nr:cytidylate kinase-like family protein [Eubacterium sp.]
MAQTIISVSREFGSGGHIIAEQIAKDHGLKFYDRHLLDDIAAENNMNAAVLEKYDEKPRNAFLSRRVSGFSNSMEEILAEMQFDYIRKKADSGESFVIVGRCAESVLSGHKGLISIFVVGDDEAKIKRVEKVYGLNTSEAILKMKRHDKKRRQYHNRHSSFRWGDSRNYDLCINSSKLGLDQTADALEDYIRARISQMQG